MPFSFFSYRKKKRNQPLSKGKNKTKLTFLQNCTTLLFSLGETNVCQLVISQRIWQKAAEGTKHNALRIMMMKILPQLNHFLYYSSFLYINSTSSQTFKSGAGPAEEFIFGGPEPDDTPPMASIWSSSLFSSRFVIVVSTQLVFTVSKHPDTVCEHRG